MRAGTSKSQCGQSEEYSSCVSAWTALNVASSRCGIVTSSGCDVKYISEIYSLGNRFSSGASDCRIRYSWSSRCIMNGTQASPLSIQINFSFGNLSGRPLMIQLARWVMLQVTKDIECTERNRVIIDVIVSPHVGPA